MYETSTAAAKISLIFLSDSYLLLITYKTASKLRAIVHVVRSIFIDLARFALSHTINRHNTYESPKAVMIFIFSDLLVMISFR